MNTIKQIFSIEKMDFLIALYIFCIVVTELMGGKTTPLPTIFGFKLHASVAIFLVPIVYVINDAVIEVFGFSRARSIVRSGILMIFGVFLFSLFAVSLPPSFLFLANEKAYSTIFGISARIAAASLSAFVLAEIVDIFVFNKLKQNMHGKALWFRNGVANVLSEFFDTTVFLTLAFYAVGKPFGVNALFLISLIIPYWILKSCMALLETPLLYLCVNWLRKK